MSDETALTRIYFMSIDNYIEEKIKLNFCYKY